jgi:preprotein translocase subunit SecY
MERIFRVISGLWEVKDIRDRILFTLIVIFFYRVGTHIPIPGVNASALAEYFKVALQNTSFGMFDIFAGGALSRAAIFGLGIMPYISASIVVQLLSSTVPYFERLQREGEHGRRILNRYSRWLTVLISALQSFGIASFLQSLTSPSGLPVVPNPGPLFLISTMLSLVGGSVLLMWMGEQITDRGIGNGASVLIFAGSLDSLPNEIISTYTLWKNGAVSTQSVIFMIAFLVVLTGLVVIATEVHRKVPISYAKRTVGISPTRQTGYLPLTINTAGVMPIIFAQSILLFPQTAFTFTGEGFFSGLAAYFQPGTLTHDVVYALLIIFFAYLYTSIVFNPKDVADNLQRASAFIPGVRAGEETAEYIDRIMTRLILPGALFFSFVAIVPYHVSTALNIPLYFGGTRLLIIVGVALDILQKLNSYLIMYRYESLVGRAKVRSWRGIGIE